MTKVINFCAGPSAGKTTCGLRLAGMMKAARLNVLYVPEFALELVVAERFKDLDDQLYILGEQAHRLYTAKDQFDWVVTDAPLFMQLYYIMQGNSKYRTSKVGDWMSAMGSIVMTTFERYENYTFFVNRGDRKFLQTGRIQNKEESMKIDLEIVEILCSQGIDYSSVSTAEEAWTNLCNRGVLHV